MEIEILSKVENKLLDRIEITFVVKYPNAPTPPRSDVRKKLAALLAADENLLLIRFMKPRTGSHSAFGLAHLYKTREQAIFVEPKHIIVRNEGKSKEVEKEA